MDIANMLSFSRFPVVYEGDEMKAVLVDIKSFTQIRLILENLLNPDIEPEDAILAASHLLQQLVEHTKSDPPAADWRQELNAL